MKPFVLTGAFLESKKLPIRMSVAFVMAVALLIVSAKIQIPFWPVPMTMQSAVVLLLPCMLGVRLGVASILTYLGLGAAGYPVFAHAANALAGPAYFMGPTGGYLFGFVVAGLVVGYVYENAHKARTLPVMAGLMLLGHVVIFALGVAWLAYGAPALGVDKAMAVGLIPFISGSFAKSALVALCVYAFKGRAPKS